MNCPECEKTKERSEFCSCCGNQRKITFNRYVQYLLGWVLWLDDSGNDADIYTMIERCEYIIETCFRKYNKRYRPKLQKYEGDSNVDPSVVMRHYTNQFN